MISDRIFTHEMNEFNNLIMITSVLYYSFVTTNEFAQLYHFILNESDYNKYNLGPPPPKKEQEKKLVSYGYSYRYLYNVAFNTMHTFNIMYPTRDL